MIDKRLICKALALALLTLGLFVGTVVSDQVQAEKRIPKITGYVYPIVAPRISSNYGKRVHPKLKTVRHHKGIDLAAPEGALVRSIGSGTVVFADPYKGYGNLIVLRHKGGMTSHYGHLSEIKVKPGDKVRGGDIIAKVGSTGLSTGPHLHFEIRIDGEALDPSIFISDLADPGEG